MSAFSSRTKGYKFGVILLFVATVGLLVGVVAPYWMTKSYTYSENDGSGDWDLKLHEGPWLLCVSATAGQSSGGGSSSTSCHAFGFELEIWYHVVRAVVTVGVVVLLVACVLTLVTNCFKDDPGPRRRILEPLAFLGGVLAMGGVVAYDALRNDELPSTQSLEMDAFNISSPVLQGPDWKYNWAIFLTGSVAMLAVLAAIVIAVNNKEEPQRYGGAPFGREEKRGKDRDNGKSADKNGKLADKNGKSADKKGKSADKNTKSAEKGGKSGRSKPVDKNKSSDRKGRPDRKDKSGDKRSKSADEAKKAGHRSKSNDGKGKGGGQSGHRDKSSNGKERSAEPARRASQRRSRSSDYPAYAGGHGGNNPAFGRDYPGYGRDIPPDYDFTP